MKTLRDILFYITYPITAILTLIVIYDESRRMNEDGSWDKYWERKNKRYNKKIKRQERKETR